MGDKLKGENVYTGRFPFKMRLYVNDIAFSHFSLNVVPWYPTGSKKIVSVSDISVLNLIASRAVGCVGSVLSVVSNIFRLLSLVG